MGLFWLIGELIKPHALTRCEKDDHLFSKWKLSGITHPAMLETRRCAICGKSQFREVEIANR